MTDLIPAPVWHSVAAPDARLADARAEITRLTDALRFARDRRAQAEDAQQIAEEDKRAAEQRADREADRADGAEAHLIAVLAAHHIDPDLPRQAAESIAESIRQDLDGGLAVAEVPEQARRLAADGAEEGR